MNAPGRPGPAWPAAPTGTTPRPDRAGSGAPDDGAGPPDPLAAPGAVAVAGGPPPQGPALESFWQGSSLPTLGPHDWESVLSQARRTRLQARLAQHLADRGWLPAVPPAPRTHLHNALKEARRKHDEVRWETDRITAALADLPTPVVLLKGAAYVMAGLPPGRGRLFGDVDILVPRAALREVEGALLAAGWVPQKLDPYDERYYRDWMHELPPLQHVARRTLLDVHHTITPPTSRFAVDGDALIARARAVAGHPRLSVLAPADMVLHAAVHLMQDGDFTTALRDLLDIDGLVRHFAAADPGFWPELLERARTLGFGRVLADVLDQSVRLYGTPVPAGLQAAAGALGRGGLRGRLMRRLLDTAVRPDHPDRDTALTPLARRALYVRSHWLRMPWHQILPHLARKAWRRVTFRRPPRPAQPPGA